MEKSKLRPIDQLAQAKWKENRPKTPAYYPSDMKYKLLPGLCRSGVLSKLSEDITNLTRMIKTEKPLTLKTSKWVIEVIDRKNALKVAITVEDYLSGIDIGLLEIPTFPINSIGDVLSLIGAKDEREAIVTMYQALAMIEVYFNRMIQHVLISSYNATKENADKSINEYFESEFRVVNELMESYQEIVIKQRKKGDIVGNAGDKVIKDKLKELQDKNKSLKDELEKLKKREKSKKITTSIETGNSAEMKAIISNLEKKLEKVKIDYEEALKLIAQKDIELKAKSEKIQSTSKE